MTNNSNEVSADVLEASVSQEQTIEVTTPILVELGKQKPKQIKALKRGEGKLMNEVAEVLEEVAVNLGDEVEGKTLVPVILVYEKKRKKKEYRLFNL